MTSPAKSSRHRLDSIGKQLEPFSELDQFSASPWPTAKTAVMLREQDQYERLKALDMWPFGELGGTAEQKPN
jgi:hypothetical protein